MPQIEGTGDLKAAVGEYDFAVDGGALGQITLRSSPGDVRGNDIPAGAIIEGGLVEVDTAVLSATGTVSADIEAVADFMAATAQAGLTIGRKSVTPAFAGAGTLKTTVRRQIKITIATAALTAGKFRVIAFYR